tara:strand:+ start:526 stop:1209 length:684 start_codon:yes stop_codon:yes gene_type:complete
MEYTPSSNLQTEMSLNILIRKRLGLGVFSLIAGGSLLATLLFSMPTTPDKMTETSKDYPSIILGGGCFWCVEAVYETLDGIIKTESGFAGGHVKDPSYNAVVTGQTGHAEVVKVTFDPEVIELGELLDFFWIAHDPTTLNRQGADRGTQYRSIILYSDDDQKAATEASMQKAQSDFSDPIVTEVAPLDTFYEAEKYHQDYYENNKNQSYCQYVIKPKLKKLEKASKK